MMLSVLLSVLAAVGALVLVVLVVPFQLRADAQAEGAAISGELRLRWGFGLVGVRLSSRRPSGLTVCGLRVAGLPARDRQKKKEKKRARDEPSRRGALWALAHRRGIERVAGRMLGALGLRLEVWGRLGLGDPTDTALVTLIAGELGRLPGVTLDITWDYLDELVELDVRGQARLWPLELVGVALALLVGDRDVRALLRAPA